jgi:glycosyltransferase involved in cell wall biosynthesis
VSIVIPQYSEQEKDLLPCLSMIDSQIGVDFDMVEVVIVNDASPKLLSKTYLAGFSRIHPKYIRRKKNGGPGPARQTGIDNAAKEYVYFMDADDSFYSIDSLAVIMNNLDGCDVLSTDKMEEMSERKCTILAQNMTWVHGKAYRKQFLTDNGIRFSDDKRIGWAHEDSYFNYILGNKNPVTKHLNTLCYAWRHNTASIARRDNGLYSYSSFATFLYAIHKAINDTRPTGYSITQLTLYAYITLCRKDWMAEDKVKYREDAIIELVSLLTEYSGSILPIGSFLFNSIYSSEMLRNKVDPALLVMEYPAFLAETAKYAPAPKEKDIPPV